MYTVAVLCVCVYSRGARRRNFAEGFSGVRARSRGMVYVYERSRRVPASAATAAECDPRGKRIKLPPRREQRTIRRAIREGGVQVTERDGGEGEIARRNEPDIGEVSSAGCGFFIRRFFSFLFFSFRISFLPESTFRNVPTWRRRDFRLIAVN